jgi:CO dehydrogenase nickel-insertion accessory protein CooC1
MDICIENTYLVINRLHGEMAEPLQQRIGVMDIPLLGIIPADAELAAYEFSGRPLIDLGEESPVYTAVADMLQTIGI